jgi:hypothetical protein
VPYTSSSLTLLNVGMRTREGDVRFRSGSTGGDCTLDRDTSRSRCSTHSERHTVAIYHPIHARCLEFVEVDRCVPEPLHAHRTYVQQETRHYQHFIQSHRECIWQYLVNRRQDAFFGLEMNIWLRHPLCFAIAHDAHGKQVEKGWATPDMGNCPEDHDRSLCNMFSKRGSPITRNQGFQRIHILSFTRRLGCIHGALSSRLE